MEGRQPTGIDTVVYRVSKRQGALGFSLTAGEEKPVLSSSRSTGGMVVTTCRCSVEPALYSASSGPQMLVGGLHYFGFRPLLSSLADTIMEASVNVATRSSSLSATDIKKDAGCKFTLS